MEIREKSIMIYKKVSSWFDIIELEHNILDFWKRHNIFQKLLEKNKNGERWSFLDGPITANNPMGVHHAWGRALKDMYQRYWTTNGRQLRYQNGFDCQGLWVEVEVEKELGFTSKKDIEKYGIDKFVNKCKERVLKYSKIITDQSIRLGYWMDWENSYYTMSDENNYTLWSFLKKCHARGLIYKGRDVMPWCPRCGTGISQHEMQEGYKEVKHLSVIVIFPIQGREKETFLVWTTTPWTLPANVALAVHPDLDYVKVKQGDRFYYLVKDRMEIVLSKKTDWEVIEQFKGRDLLKFNFKYVGPFDEIAAQRNIEPYHKIIPYKDISKEEGTGIVHIAPGCGVEDFALGKEFNLPSISPINESGFFENGFDWLEGRHASKVAVEIAEHLKRKGILYSSEEYLHSYPHCWRCDEELLFRLVDEWFIAMAPLREEIKENAKKIKWVPSYGLDLELDWLSNMKDWMISKKRYWGLALPIWECIGCNDFCVIGSFEELKEKAVEGWNKFEGHSPHRPWIDAVKIKCPKCGRAISKIPDVGNPWLDAGIVPYSTVKYNTDRDYWRNWIPADLVIECFPGQFRNWFYSLLAMSTIMENIPPLRVIVGHALVRDEKGEEMHKSKGNTILFDEAAEKIGAEVMRWMFFNQEITSNLNFGYKAAELVRYGFFNTLWNCYAFYANYARVIGYTPPKVPSGVSKKPIFDRWVLSKLQLVIKACRSYIEEYNLKEACQVLNDFVDTLSNWYIRNNRRRFWKSEINEETLFAYETLFDCLFTVIRLLSPMLPLITEEIYQNIVRSWNENAPESIHLVEYPIMNSQIIDERLNDDMDTVIKIYHLALSAREKAKIRIRQPLLKLVISLNSSDKAKVIGQFKELLKENLNVKKINILRCKTKCPIEIQIKPNMKTLDLKYGSKSRYIAEVINNQSNFIIKKIEQNLSKVDLSINGGKIELDAEDLLVEEIVPPNLCVTKSSDGWLAFDTTITEELIIEGFMRDFLRKMQSLRKDMGLEIEDRVVIRYKTDSINLLKVIKKFRNYISNELLCLKLLKVDSIENGIEIKVSSEKIIVKVEKVRVRGRS